MLRKPLRILSLSFILFCLWAVSLSAAPADASGYASGYGIDAKASGKTIGHTALKDTLRFYQLRKKMLRNERDRVSRIIEESPEVASLRRLSEDLQNSKIDTAYLRVVIDRLGERIDLILKKDTLAPPDPGAPADSLGEKPAPDPLIQKLISLLEKKTDRYLEEAAWLRHIRKVNELLGAKNHEGTDTVRIDSVSKKVYTYRLRRKASLFGYHPGWSNSKHRSYNYKVLNTLAFYAYHLNGKTGDPVSTNNWSTSEVITKAQQEGCKVVLVVHSKSSDTIATFLKTPGAQKRLGDNLVELLAERNANGVNILFESMRGIKKERFSRFLNILRSTLKAADPAYELSVTIPAYDSTDAFDLAALDTLADRIVIDFTKMQKKPGAIAPLDAPKYGIKEGLGRLLKHNIDPARIIVSLPYRGVLWDADNPKKPHYITYDTIKRQYADFSPFYTDTSAAILAVEYGDKDTLQKIWYDDDITLRKKLSYILGNDVGGIGVWALGYDNGHPELWNVMAAKLFVIDTLRIDTLRPPVREDESFWGKFRDDLHIIKLLFVDPCHEDANISKVDADELLLYWVLPILGGLLILLLLFYVYKLRYVGDAWKWKKAVLRVLIVLVMLVIISSFIYLFLADDIAIIGPAARDKCQETSLLHVLYTVGIGFVCGMLVMRFLIMPLMHDDEEP